MAKKKMLISCSGNMLDKSTLGQLERIFDLVEIGCNATEDDLLRNAEDAHGIMIGGFEKITLPVIMKMLETSGETILIFLGIQYDTFFTEEALEFLRRKNITVSATGEGVEDVAKRTLEIILTWNPLEIQMKMAEFNPNPPSVDAILAQQCVVVVGAGKIGTKVAEGLIDRVGEVRYWDLHENDALKAKGGIFNNDLLKAMEGADVVTLHVPLNPATANIIKYDHLKVMASGSLMINAARHGLIDLDGVVKVMATKEMRHVWDVNIKNLSSQDQNKVNLLIRGKLIRLTGHTFAISRNSKKERGMRLIALLKNVMDL